MNPLAELRLGRPADYGQAMEEIERKINEMIRLLNELVEAAEGPPS